MAVLAMYATAAPLFADEIPAGRFADLTLKILTFDRNLQKRVSKVITIAIVSSGRNHDKAEALAAAFQERRDKKVNNYSFDVKTLSLDDPRKLRALFAEDHFTCVIAVEPTDDDLRLISELSRERGVISIGSRKEDVNPLSLAFVAERNQVKIYRSDVALTAENVVFPPDFLNITRAR